MTLSKKRNKTLGYGICGPNEKYLKKTLDCFKRLCDHTVILGNNIDNASVELIESYGFDIKHDNREWGLNQHKIKEDFVFSLKEYEPEWLIALDMDEVLDVTREELELFMQQTDSMYVYIVNLWGKGWKRQWSFWNIRVWKWNGITNFVNRPLHCGLAPEWAYHYGSYVPIVLIHSGLKSKQDRDRKIKRYEQYDPKAVYRDSSYYQALKEDSYEPLDMGYIKASLQKEIKDVKRKTPRINKERKFFFVKMADGRIVDIPESQLHDTLKRGAVLVKSI